jgi:leucyl aminopeptidase (aminopeptidase T)
MATDSQSAVLNGAIALLLKCVSLEIGDTFALFYDETSDDVFDVMHSAAEKLGLVMLSRRVETGAQARFGKGEELSLDDLTALSDAMAIVTVLSDHAAGTPYRGALIKAGAAADKRLAHMPGVRPEFFEHAVDVDYGTIARRCDDLAFAMAIGQTALIKSYCFDDLGNSVQENELRFSIGGIDRLPVVSTGLIPRGTWGNVPGAETFIAPVEGTAEGKYVLNGSFKDHVLSGTSNIVLTFAGGRLVNIEGTEDILPAFRRFIAMLQSRVSPKALCLAEFGIGVNPAIDHLVGKPLMDEKCVGTAHIAIGGNSGYGGTLVADVHEDFVTRLPTVEIDDRLILENGNDKFVSREWRESITDASSSCCALEPPVKIRRTFVSAEVCTEALKVRRRFGADRMCTYTIGEPATSKLLAYVYARVPNLPAALDPISLAKLTNIDSDLLTAALRILTRHRLLEIVSR